MLLDDQLLNVLEIDQTFDSLFRLHHKPIPGQVFNFAAPSLQDKLIGGLLSIGLLTGM
jgi:hypothetical protein